MRMEETKYALFRPWGFGGTTNGLPNTIAIKKGANLSMQFSLINDILQAGTTDATHRIGNKIYVTDILITCRLIPLLSAMPTSGSHTRVTVMHQKLPAAASNALLTNDAIFEEMFGPVLQPLQPKIRVMRDYVHTTVCTSTGTCGPPLLLNWRIPVHKVISYNGSSGSAAITYDGTSTPGSSGEHNGNLLYEDYIFQIVAADEKCTAAEFEWRVRFKDA